MPKKHIKLLKKKLKFRVVNKNESEFVELMH